MTHASLFSGIGGPEVAAAMMGWENAFHCEINPFGKQVLDYWFPNSQSYEDITKTDFTPWRGKIDVLTGGFPCQPFSYAGKRGGREDERYLWQEMFRAISEIRPTWVVGENVAGVTTMVEGWVLSDLGCHSSLFQEGDNIHGYELKQTFTIERICRDLEGIGYSVQPMLIPAAGVNAPHRRDRVFIIAFDADSDRSNDQGETGGYEGEGEGEGLQERHSLRKPGEPDQLRSPLQVSTSDTECDGYAEREYYWRPRCEARTSAMCGKGYVGEGTASDSELPGLEGQDQLQCGESLREHLRRDITGHDWAADRGLLPEHRWEGFPTVSAVHRGNDGIPFPLDNLTISPARWRQESLKAYGNAIVPQVMYRIFQAIEEASK